jgi:hypothetical protein
MEVRVILEFIGYSSYGSPRFIALARNVTEEIDIEKELLNKKHELSEMSQKLNLLKVLPGCYYKLIYRDFLTIVPLCWVLQR